MNIKAHLWEKLSEAAVNQQSSNSEISCIPPIPKSLVVALWEVDTLRRQLSNYGNILSIVQNPQKPLHNYINWQRHDLSTQRYEITVLILLMKRFFSRAVMRGWQ